MLDFAGKVAVVTGGAGGMGEATARLMAAGGAHVVVADRDGAGAELLAKQLREAGGHAVAAVVDLAEGEDAIVDMLDVAAREFSGLDILCNIAAATTAADFGVDGSLGDFDPGGWARIFNANVFAVGLSIKHAIPHLLLRGGGAIVNVASTASLLATIDHPAYGSSKAAVMQLTRHVAVEYGKQNIRCNCVAPGLTLTPVAKTHTAPKFQDMWERHVLLPRLGDAQDIANVIGFLASDMSGFMTGLTLPVDGGFTVHDATYADYQERAGRLGSYDAVRHEL